MIVNRVQGDVFCAPQKRIGFAVNIQGYNDAGFAGQVSSRYWPELISTGGNRLGEVLRHNYCDKIFYALVCHSLDANGWAETPTVVEECLNKIEMRDDEEIAVVLMGSGFIGQMQGADVYDILEGIARSKKKVVVYTL